MHAYSMGSQQCLSAIVWTFAAAPSQEHLSRLQADMAKRNQTLLALQADLEMASRDAARRAEQVAALEDSVAKLQVRGLGNGEIACGG